MLAAKAAGAAHLDELTAGLDLDAFVMFSSAAAILGSAGQGNYGAANAFLDGLAQRRAAAGRAGLSVAYGPWAGEGVALASEAVRKRLERGPQPPMDPRLAVLALGHAMAGGDSLLAVMDVKWAQFTADPGAARRPFVRDLPEVQAAAAAGDTAELPVGGELARQLAGLGRAEQLRLLTDLVREQAAAVLGHGSADAVEPDRAFRELGFDSLTALEMRQRMSIGTGLRLPSTLLFDYPTPGGPGRLSCGRGWSVTWPPMSRAGRGGGNYGGARTSRSRSWRWAAAIPAGSPARRSSGSWWPRAGTRSRPSRWTGAGTWKGHWRGTREADGVRARGRLRLRRGRV